MAELSSQLATPFLAFSIHIQHAIRRVVGVVPPSPQIGSRGNEMDPRLPTVGAALVLATQCLVTLLLSVKQHNLPKAGTGPDEAAPLPRDTLCGRSSAEGQDFVENVVGKGRVSSARSPSPLALVCGCSRGASAERCVVHPLTPRFY